MDGKSLEQLAQQNKDWAKSERLSTSVTSTSPLPSPVLPAPSVSLDAPVVSAAVEFEAVPPPAQQPEVTFLQLKTPATQSYDCECLDKYERDGLTFYHAYISAAELFLKKLPLDANPRRPMANDVTRAMQATLSQSPERFHVLNNGITIICNAVDIITVPAEADKEESRTIVQMTFGKKEKHGGFGICNGGHTYMSILTLAACPDERATVHTEVIVLPQDIAQYQKTAYIRDIARARNSHSELRTTTEANYAGLYDYIRGFLGEFDNQVKWMEGDRAAVKDAIDAQAFIAALCALSPSWFTHPYYRNTRTHKKAADSPGTVHSEWMTHKEKQLDAQFAAMEPCEELADVDVGDTNTVAVPDPLASPETAMRQESGRTDAEQCVDETPREDGLNAAQGEAGQPNCPENHGSPIVTGEGQALPAVVENVTASKLGDIPVAGGSVVTDGWRHLDDIAPLAADVFNIVDMVGVSLFAGTFKGAKKSYKKSKLWKVFRRSRRISRGKLAGKDGSLLGPPYQVMLLGLFRWNVWLAYQPEDIERPLVGWMRDCAGLWEDNQIDVISTLQDLTESYTKEDIAKQLASEPAAFADTLQLIKLQYGKEAPLDLVKGPYTFWAPSAEPGVWDKYVKADDPEKAVMFLTASVTEECQIIAELSAKATPDAVPYQVVP